MESSRNIKVALVGDTQVGKTSISTRFIYNRFDFTPVSTTGGQYKKKIIFVNQNQVQINIWDTAGQERFRALSELYYRSASAIILVYDVTRMETFLNLKYWIGELRAKGDKNAVIVMVGNKIDAAERVVSKAQAAQLAAEEKVFYKEASALSGESVCEIFNLIVEQVQIMQNPTEEVVSVKIQEQKDKKWFACC
ncbi:Rab11 [Hexamita inflata]|uniref:Rab11 n=1 Tax=Hexamita inflata TaxID=28002 RepID=A0AA86NX37_9EUKA|nr:Rab11 [Hexamita inflata]